MKKIVAVLLLAAAFGVITGFAKKETLATVRAAQAAHQLRLDAAIEQASK